MIGYAFFPVYLAGASTKACKSNICLHIFSKIAINVDSFYSSFLLKSIECGKYARQNINTVIYGEQFAAMAFDAIYILKKCKHNYNQTSGKIEMMFKRSFPKVSLRKVTSIRLTDSMLFLYPISKYSLLFNFYQIN